MKESLTPLRVLLSVIGALALLNLGIVVQIKAQPDISTLAIVFSLVFAALSLLDAMALFFSAWQLERLLAKNARFIKFAILFRYALLLVERVPFAIAGDYLSISLVLLWSGVTFYMVKMTDRLAAGEKAAGE